MLLEKNQKLLDLLQKFRLIVQSFLGKVELQEELKFLLEQIQEWQQCKDMLTKIMDKREGLRWLCNKLQLLFNIKMEHNNQRRFKMPKLMEELLILNSNLMTKEDQILRKLHNKCLKSELFYR